MLGGVTGRRSALHITRLFGRPSILIFILVALLVISGLIMLIELIIDEPEWALTNPCN